MFFFSTQITLLIIKLSFTDKFVAEIYPRVLE